MAMASTPTVPAAGAWPLITSHGELMQTHESLEPQQQAEGSASAFRAAFTACAVDNVTSVAAGRPGAADGAVLVELHFGTLQAKV